LYSDGKGKSPLHLSDAQLVRRWQDGDAAAFAEAARRYARSMGAVAYAVQMVDDIVQESFSRAASGIGEMRQAERLGPYLTGIARNVARDSLRRKSRNGREHDVPHLDRRTPSLRAGQNELAERLRRALEELPDDQREIFSLKYQTRQSYTEIARTLGMSEGAVAQKLLRVRRKLQEALKDFHDE